MLKKTALLVEGGFPYMGGLYGAALFTGPCHFVLVMTLCEVVL